VGDRAPGPVVQLQGHVALIPMVRIGAYFSYDVSPLPPVGTRSFYEGGLHLRVTPPLLPAPWRLWVYGGLGYAYTYAASYHRQETIGMQSVDVLFNGVPGGLLEAPLGFGLGYRLRGVAAPWMPFVELGGRGSVWFFGPMYLDPQSVTAQGYRVFGPYAGKDSFALTLSVGLSLEP
jgi:hypothetical protein